MKKEIEEINAIKNIVADYNEVTDTYYLSYLTPAQFDACHKALIKPNAQAEMLEKMAEVLEFYKKAVEFEYTIELDKRLLNESAKPPYDKLFAMTDLGNMIMQVFRNAGFESQFTLTNDKPSEFKGFILKHRAFKEANHVNDTNVAEMKYLVWSNEHNSWWGKDHSGYVQRIQNAGRYTLEEALTICNEANYGWDTDNIRKLPQELPVSEEAAIALEYSIHGIKQQAGDKK